MNQQENNLISRKDFIKISNGLIGAVLIAPYITFCKPKGKKENIKQNPQLSAIPIPDSMPNNWNPIDYNKKRANSGAVPKSYLKDINSEDGVKKHIGKHLPYIPSLSIEIQKPFIPLMWGDPKKGHSQHPNAPKKEGYIGHWYNWIRIKKATTHTTNEIQTNYLDWPHQHQDANGRYTSLKDDDITKNQGKNTIYLAVLPNDIIKGDIIRIHAHCLTHGEWVDFIKV